LLERNQAETIPYMNLRNCSIRAWMTAQDQPHENLFIETNILMCALPYIIKAGVAAGAFFIAFHLGG